MNELLERCNCLIIVLLLSLCQLNRFNMRGYMLFDDIIIITGTFIHEWRNHQSMWQSDLWLMPSIQHQIKEFIMFLFPFSHLHTPYSLCRRFLCPSFTMIHIKGSEHSNWIKWQLFKFELLILQIRFQLNFNPLVVVVVVDVGVYSVVKSATNPPAIKIVFA